MSITNAKNEDHQKEGHQKEGHINTNIEKLVK